MVPASESLVTDAFFKPSEQKHETDRLQGLFNFHASFQAPCLSRMPVSTITCQSIGTSSIEDYRGLVYAKLVHALFISLLKHTIAPTEAWPFQPPESCPFALHTVYTCAFDTWERARGSTESAFSGSMFAIDPCSNGTF